MRPQELMLGDYVRDKYDHFVKVKEIYSDSIFTEDGEYEGEQLMVGEFEPIPLTSAILEKNGFTKSERYEVWKIISDDYELRITPWRVAVIFLDKDGSDKEEFSAPRPKYVHQLQRALRICGIEKEVEL